METLKFTDYTDEQLVGMSVVWTRGVTYAGQNRSVKRITRVTKTQISIEGTDDKFDKLGFVRGRIGRMNWGSVSRIELISEETKAELINQWGENAAYQKLLLEFKKKSEHLYANPSRTREKVDFNTLKTLTESIPDL